MRGFIMKITRRQLRRLIKESFDEERGPKIKSVYRVPGKPRESKVTLADGKVLRHLDVKMSAQVPEGNSHPSKWESSAARVSIKVGNAWYKYTNDHIHGVVDSVRMDKYQR